MKECEKDTFVNLKRYTTLQSTGLHHLNGSQGSSVQKYLSVQKIYYHWFFRGWHSKYDIALLKLTKPVILTDKVNTVCLPKNSTEVKPGTECYITGKTCNDKYQKNYKYITVHLTFS